MSKEGFDKNKLLEEFNNRLANESDNTGYFFNLMNENIYEILHKIFI